MKGEARVAGIDLERRELAPGRLSVYVAREPDALLADLDEAEFEATDERMPYFATLWPSGERLAHAVLQGPSLEGRTVLDLGCGVGAAGLAALVRGARTTFLDWEPRALEIVAASACAQGLAPSALVVADWREPPPRLPCFDLVLAADVLYEARNVPAVAGFLARYLTPSGEAWIADPRRDHAVAFPEAAAAAGLTLQSRDLPTTGGPGVTVHLHRVMLRGPTS